MVVTPNTNNYRVGLLTVNRLYNKKKKKLDTAVYCELQAACIPTKFCGKH